jgi:signal transduction histidine kinase
VIKNKDFRVLLGISSSFGLISSFALLFIDEIAAVAVFCVSLVFILMFCIFIKYRYSKLNDLSNYLRQVSSGEYCLDIRDNVEGELSILKNEIYKVSVRLVEQAELLQRDKLFLANSISDISHQLKTPLTSMFVMTDLLGQDNLPIDKRIEFTSNIRSQLERIEWLVTSLLKLSKLDAGTIVMKKEVVNVSQMIERALQHLLIPIELKEQNLVIRGDTRVSYIGDFNWSAEAFTNIIKNCIEHTKNKGEIKIEFEDNTIYTRIEVSDNGIGIHKEDISFIFDRFFKGKNASTESIGIGLAMSKNIFLKQGGSITVDSKLGVGTKFIIKIFKSVI